MSRKIKKNSMQLVLLVVILVVSSCTTTPPIPVDGSGTLSDNEAAFFSFKGTGFYGLLLYSIDGKPRTEISDQMLLQASYSNTLMCGFNLRLKPGLHRFEFYTVDTNPIQIFTLTFPLKAGSVYELIGSSNEQKILEDGNEIAVERGEVPVLVEPEPNEPHATLVIQRDKLHSRNVYVLRIDGKIRAPMYKLHPRWVVMNYSGLARGVTLFVPKGPFLDLAAYIDLLPSNIEAAEGALGLRLSPGPHRIEYVAESVRNTELGNPVRIIEYNFLAGKEYRVKVVPDTEKTRDWLENHIEIIPTN